MKFRTFVAILALAAVFAIVTPFANAATITEDCNSNTLTLPWVTDRAAPASFGCSSQHIALTLAADQSKPVGDFYATQGKKILTGIEAVTASVDMYIDPSFEGDGRIGGFWTSAADATNTIVSYQVAEFRGDTGFQFWDNNSASWIVAGTPSGFAYGQWYHLEMVLNTISDQVMYSVNGELSTIVGAAGGTHYLEAFLQGINYDPGVDRTILFDNVALSEVPVPPTLPLFVSGLVGLGFAGWGRRKGAKKASVHA